MSGKASAWTLPRTAHFSFAAWKTVSSYRYIRGTYRCHTAICFNIGHISRKVDTHLTTRDFSYAALFAALSAVSAQVTIPLPFVPLTLQVAVALLAGFVLGRRVGALSQIVYIIMGVAGLPVFSARQGGPGVLVGPTGGYIVGFVLAAYLVGLVYEQVDKKGMTGLAEYVASALAMLLGLVAIYVPGVLVLSWHTGSVGTAISIGVVAFLPADLIKAFIAYSVARGLKVRGVVRRPMQATGR